jgi:hypothetical protein
MTGIAEVTTALMTSWAALDDLEGVGLFDGPPVANSIPARLVLIGENGDPLSDAQSTFQRAWVDMACTRMEETGEIICAAIAQSGSIAIDSIRAAAETLVAAISDSLIADMTLGGVVYSAVLDQGTGRTLQTADGATYIAGFTVRYRLEV